MLVRPTTKTIMLSMKKWLSPRICRMLVSIGLLFGLFSRFIPYQCISSRCIKQNGTQKSSTAQQISVLPFLKDQWRYCIQIKCENIQCSNIHQSDPGEVTSAFIENIFKAQCNSNIVTSLMVASSTFPDNELRENWLKTDVKIKELTLLDCSLDALSDRAFSSMIYKKTKKLCLLNNDISALRSTTFHHLPSLQELSIVNNKIKRAEKNLLVGVASTLQILQLEKAIEDTEVLRNITGGIALPEVQVLSLQFNNITIIDKSLFTGVPNIVSLYISESQVKAVRADAFKPIFRSVKQLLMSGNNIATLPKGLGTLFNSIIRRCPDFALMIHDNPWHCDCDLEWMRDMMRLHPKVVKKTLICESPDWNIGKSFNVANFCDETTRVTSTTTSIPTTSSTTEASTTIPVNCNVSDQPFHFNYTYPASKTSFNMSFRNFSAEQLENGSIRINLPNLLDSTFLLWFANNERSDIDNLRESIQCVGRVRGSFLLSSLLARTSYTVCLFNDHLLSFSPLNCLGLTTGPSRVPVKSFPINGTIISVFVALLILMCLLSAVIMFVAVRRHPAIMLRGSKRVVIVKRKTLDAMVLPKGLPCDVVLAGRDRNAIPTISQNLEDEYITPLSPIRDSTRNSRSSASSTSYISGIEPTHSQLNSWKRKRAKYTNFRGTESPPLPPPLPQRNPHTQSLTITMSLEEDGFVI